MIWKYPIYIRTPLFDSVCQDDEAEAFNGILEYGMQEDSMGLDGWVPIKMSLMIWNVMIKYIYNIYIYNIYI